MSAMTARFWGTRGSIPAPGAKTWRYGGNTSCVELRCSDHILILDAGTGIRELGDSLMKEFRGLALKADLFITHTHWDHIQGFPFFVPAYVPGNRFRIHGVRGAGKSFETVFRGLMDPSYFPVDLGDMLAILEFVELSGEPFQCAGVRVHTAFTNHPGMDMAYRFTFEGRCVVYLTDHETYQTMNQVTEFARKQDRAIEDFCRGADLLICDAQYTEEEYRTKKAWGHSRYKDSVLLGLAASVKRLALFHHDPCRDDEQLDAMSREVQDIVRRSGQSVECFFAQEGMRVEL